jgi:hypothetical protein
LARFGTRRAAILIATSSIPPAAAAKSMKAEWKGIRRGWYLGGDGFRGRLLKMIKATLRKGQAASYVGPAKQAHGEGGGGAIIGRRDEGLTN